MSESFGLIVRRKREQYQCVETYCVSLRCDYGARTRFVPPATGMGSECFVVFSWNISRVVAA